MVKLSDLLVDESLHGLGTDQSDINQSPVWFLDVIYHNRRPNLVFTTTWRSNVRKNMYFSLNKSFRKFWQSVQDGGIVIDYEGFVHILIL